MDELNKEYTLLFNGITDTIRQLETLALQLKKLQARAEEAYMQQGELEQEQLNPPPVGEEEKQS